jgi:hypothetical protein
MIAPSNQASLEKFGFSFGKSGPHTARTIMHEDFGVLLNYIGSQNPTLEDFRKAIIEDNCLSKRSGKSRELTLRHFVDLYGMDCAIPIFRVMVYFWEREEAGQGLLAALCAYARDAVLRKSYEWILETPIGRQIPREQTESKLSSAYPDRYSPASLKSIAQNVNGTWTKTGHLEGRVKKYRQRVVPTPASTAFALYLGYLTGLRGEALFSSDFSKILDAPVGSLMDKAELASQRGWIVMKRLDRVVEVLFPNLISEEERRWLSE